MKAAKPSRNGTATRTPGDLHDYESALVGAILVDPKAYDAAVGIVTAADFLDTDLAEIWTLAPVLRARGFEPNDIAVLRDELTMLGKWGPNNVDAARLGRMFDVRPNNARYYAERVRESSIRRRLAGLADIAAVAYDLTIDADTLRDSAAAVIDQTRGGNHHAAILNAATMIESASSHRPAIVEGILRQGETANLIASPKVGKSWLAIQLAYAVAAGGDWLGHETTRGRVLIVDNELHSETLGCRLRRVADAIQVDQADIKGWLDVLPVRGRNLDVFGLPRLLAGTRPGHYSVVILDALYRFLPKGTSENDNAAMMQVYNELDSFAALTGAAVVVVHHSSKGDQSGKAQTDVGAGAGSIARAADCHLTIRPHEEQGLHVLESVTRSWPPSDPLSIRWEYPTWSASCVEARLAKPKTSADARQAATDQETRTRIIEAIADRKLSIGQIRGATGFGESRVIRGLALLRDAGTVERKIVKRKRSGRKVEVWHAS